MAKVNNYKVELTFKQVFGVELLPQDMTDTLLVKLLCVASGVSQVVLSFERHPNDIWDRTLQILKDNAKCCRMQVLRTLTETLDNFIMVNDQAVRLYTEQEQSYVYDNCTRSKGNNGCIKNGFVPSCFYKVLQNPQNLM
jgi:hypothetical protein